MVLIHRVRWLLVVSALQLAISTGHVGTLLTRTIRAFVFTDSTALKAYLADERAPLHTAEQALYTINVRAPLFIEVLCLTRSRHVRISSRVAF